MTSKSELITVEEFLTALEFEATTGELFLDYSRVYVDDKPSVCKYVCSKKYYFEFNTFTMLWEETSIGTIITRLEAWLRSEGGRCQRSLSDSKKDQETSELIFKTIKTVCKHKYLENVVKMITPTMTDDSIFEKLDKVQPNYLPIKNQQVINLITGETRLRSITDYFTWECPVKPVKKYSEFFIKTINSIMCDNPERINYLKKVLGYCLTGSTEAQSYFIWYGKGSNGKSLILNLLAAMLGKACNPISKGVVVNCGKKGEAGTEILSLKNLRVGTFSETSKMESLNEGTLKTLSGGDKLTARGLYRDPIEFKVFLKLIICTNHKPEFDGSDAGTTRRIKLLPFEAKFTRDKPRVGKNEYPIIENLEEILIEKHLDEFFTWCLEGTKLWSEDRGFKITPNDISQQQQAYIRSQNSFSTWFNEHIVADETKRTERAYAYKHYELYCEEQGIKKQQKKDFFDKMTDEIGKTVTVKGNVCYKGYTIKEEEGEPGTDSDNEF